MTEPQPFNLSALSEPRSRWVRAGLGDMEVLVKHIGPGDQERFRQRMLRAGIMKMSGDSPQINPGREEDFFKAYAELAVADWRNVEDNGEPKPYDPATMGRVFWNYATAFDAVRAAIQDELGFFTSNGNGLQSS